MNNGNTKSIKDYLHLYCGQLAEISNLSQRMVAYGFEDGQVRINGYLIDTLEKEDAFTIKPILRKLSSMTEEEFQEFAKVFYNSEELVFAHHGGYWYACGRELDPDFEGEVIEHINDACDDDPENVLMCEVRNKAITHGWITYEEVYHGFSLTDQAVLFRCLLSKGFDLFGLIDSGLAIEKQ